MSLEYINTFGLVVLAVVHFKRICCCFSGLFITLLGERGLIESMVEADGVENLEFEWGKKRGVGGKKKDVQFYESFTYDGVVYALYDCVYLYKEGEPDPYIGKLIKIWENADKTKKVKVLWFFRPCEILSYLGVEDTAENELFLASGDGVGLANVNPLVIELWIKYFSIFHLFFCISTLYCI